MAAAATMIPGANDKLANARQACLDALAAHAAVHDAAVAIGLFEGLGADEEAWAHSVLGQLDTGHNTTARNALRDALQANQPVSVAWREQPGGVDVLVETGPAGEVMVVFRSPSGHAAPGA